MLALAAAFAGSPAAARPAAVVPDAASTVLERLPRGYAALEPMPDGTSIDGLAAAAQLLATASRTGDGRLARRAQVLLDRLPDRDDPALLRVRAYAAQHRHDFTAATAWLDRAVAADPRDAEARLARAQVAIVQGRMQAARKDCAALAFGVDAGAGLACATAVALRSGDVAMATRLADRWLQAAPAGDGHRAYVTLLRAEAGARGGQARADGDFRAALALDPDDVRTRCAYARYLLAHGRAAAVRPLLHTAGDGDGVVFLRTLAAVANRDADAGALVAAQARRFADARRLGLPTELRDEAQFALVRGDAGAALALAQANFAAQRDYEDVRLLQRAAAAAARPVALQPLQAWARSEHVSLVGGAP